MGTVPDPLRSAKLALIAASEGEKSLGELQAPKHQQKQASLERSSNGYPFSAKVHLAREHSLDVNCRTEASMPRGERHGGVDISQSPVFSLGSSSLSKEDSLATEEEPGKNTRQGGSNGCNVKDQVLMDSRKLMNTEIEEPVTQEDYCKMVQSGVAEPLCSQADDEAILSTGGHGSIMENRTHNTNSFLIPIHQGDPQGASTAKETGGGSSGPEKPLALLSAKEVGPGSDPGLKAKVSLDSEPGSTKKASFHPSIRTQQEPPPKSSPERAPAQPLSHSETAEEPLPELLKFKDMGTMTVQAESRSADGETLSRTCQDAEVQAVASVESRSASTSPSILAAFLRENLPSEAKPKPEQLHIIYRGASGKEQSEIIDSLAVLGQTALPAGIVPKVHVQAPAGAKKRLGAQAVTLQEDLARRQDAAGLSLRDHSERPCPSGSIQEIVVKGVDVQIAPGARTPSSIAQQPLDASVLQTTKLFDQVPVHASDQPVVTPQPANLEAQLPLCSALPEISSKHQMDLSPSASGDQRASPSPCARILRSAQALVTNLAESSLQNQPQMKILDDTETGPTSCHVGINAKAEGTVIQLGSKEQKVNAIGAPAGAQTGGASVTMQAVQNISPGDNRKVEVTASQKLAAGRTESQSSCHSVPGLLAKISTMGREAKLAVPAAPSSVQAVPSPSKKKDVKPVPDTKVHVKQSKHVRDVVWDEQGMTWEVYGASLDPESLGIAIQNHLQRQIREHEKLIKAQSTQARKSISSDTSSNKKLKGRQHNVFQSMLQNFRRPNCCVRPTASSVLD